jgi:oxygen-independent coproporphyrinogen-3 oxidase
MLPASRDLYPPATRFHTGVGEADLRSAILASNDDPIPRQLAIVLCPPASSASEQESDFARMHREIDLVARLLDRDRVVVELHVEPLDEGRPLAVALLRELAEAIQLQFHLCNAPTREISLDVGSCLLKPADIGILAASGFNRIVFAADQLELSLLDAARAAGIRSIGARIGYSEAQPSGAAILPTLDAALALRPDRLVVQGILPDSRVCPGWPELIRTRLQEAGYVYIGPDHYALPHDELAVASRTAGLQFGPHGYTPHADCDLLGFGVGAITRVGGFHSQNASDVTSWRNALDAGHLPAQRGCHLTADDELRADLVQHLYCRRVIAIDELERDHGVAFRRYFWQELAQLAPCFTLGLVVDHGNRIEVCSRAWPWLRNIALCFHAGIYDRTDQLGQDLRH